MFSNLLFGYSYSTMIGLCGQVVSCHLSHGQLGSLAKLHTIAVMAKKCREAARREHWKVPMSSTQKKSNEHTVRNGERRGTISTGEGGGMMAG